MQKRLGDETCLKCFEYIFIPFNFTYHEKNGNASIRQILVMNTIIAIIEYIQAPIFHDKGHEDMNDDDDDDNDIPSTVAVVIVDDRMMIRALSCLLYLISYPSLLLFDRFMV
jgi:hypothetical protein